MNSNSPHRILTLGLFSTAALSCLALAAEVSPSSPIEQAAKAYQTGQYAQARDIYQSLIKERPGEANLYYDLANSHFRLGEKGRAVLWYERALRLEPADSDIRYNLMLARAHIKGGEENIFQKYFRLPKTRWLLETATVILWLWTCGTVLIFMKPDLSSSGMKRMIAFLFLAWLVCGGWAAGRLWDEERPWGIVVAKEAQIRSGPGPDFPVGATAPEGLKILILEERDGWDLVGLTKEGIKGWVQATNVERVELRQTS